MSDHLQLGWHPDADQISAFVDHALPPHERETLLVHLAVCPECRSVVALSLPPMEVAPPAPTRLRWFSAIALWPAAALATLILLAYAHHAITSGERQGARSQVAQLQPPQAPANPPVLSPAPSAQGPKPPAPSRRETPAESTAKPSSSHTASRRQPELGNGTYSELPLASSLVTTTTAPQALPPSAPSDSTAAASNAVPAPSQIGGAAKPSANAVLGGALNSQDYISSAQSANSSSSTTQTVETTDAALSSSYALASEDNTLSDTIPPRLPSGASVLSIVQRGRQMVAIDAKNAVFFSNDGGVHWAAVAVPWKSRALKAELVSAAARPATVISGTAMNSLAQPAATPQAAASVQTGATTAFAMVAPAPPGSLSGAVTDPTGAVVPGTVITLKGGGGQARTATSNRSGQYQLDGLSSGSYDLVASSPGFQVLTLRAVTVDASQAKVVNLTLRVGAETETVTVTNAPAAIELDPNTAPARAAVINRTLPLFAITTDAGEHWTSADGITWQRR